MDRKGVWPLSYSGIPALLNGTAMVLLTSALVMTLSSTGGEISIFLLLCGIVLNLLGVGRRVIIREDSIVLEYGFPKPVIRAVVRDVTEVLDISELSRGRLVRYFKAVLLPFVLIMVMPLAYVALKGSYPNPAYLSVMTLPVVVGVLLTTFFMFTSPSYRKFLRRAAAVAAVSSASVMTFLIGYLYRDVYGTSIFQRPADALVAMAGAMLLALFAALIAIMAGRNHIVVLVDSWGKHYAIGTFSPEIAREVIRGVLRLMTRSEGGDAVDAQAASEN